MNAQEKKTPKKKKSGGTSSFFNASEDNERKINRCGSIVAIESVHFVPSSQLLLSFLAVPSYAFPFPEKHHVLGR
jgi:hypothetical protein